MRHVFFALILFASPIAFAEMEVDMHAFSANCKSDPMGGDDNSLYGDGIRPSRNTIDQNPQYAVIGVSKKGGTHSLRKQCFRATGGEAKDKNARSQMKNIHNVTFIGSDGCAECNGKNRVDVASSCKSGIANSFTVEHLILHEVTCPKQFDQVMNPPPRKSKASRQIAARGTSTR